MPWSRSRPGGQGAKAKYRDPAHLAARKALLARFTPGDPCCLCGHPMWQARGLNADHLPGTDQYRGLSHGVGPARCAVCGRACNQRDGSVRARQRQTSSRLWW